MPDVDGVLVVNAGAPLFGAAVMRCPVYDVVTARFGGESEETGDCGDNVIVAWGGMERLPSGDAKEVASLGCVTTLVNNCPPPDSLAGCDVLPLVLGVPSLTGCDLT
mmetsp:Transcript_38233/g.60508  ORF Transcript_38233/g.60508 Transcript_38233/m.60508 type:complete len:107 (+) Transcript_38233:200-520(+)